MSKSMNPVGRPHIGPRKDVHVRVPDAMLLELYSYNPQMLSPAGGVRYGALQEYLLRLLSLDLEAKRRELISQGHAR